MGGSPSDYINDKKDKNVFSNISSLYLPWDLCSFVRKPPLIIYHGEGGGGVMGPDDFGCDRVNKPDTPIWLCIILMIPTHPTHRQSIFCSPLNTLSVTTDIPPFFRKTMWSFKILLAPSPPPPAPQPRKINGSLTDNYWHSASWYIWSPSS